MGRFELLWEITAQDEGKLLRTFLIEQGISKAALTDIKFSGGEILANGREVTVRYEVKNGDRIKVIFPPEAPSVGLYPEDLPLNIVYEDEYVLVVNKPAGMSTIPSREHPAGSLANAIIGHYKKNGLTATAHIVTRLDRDTSGLVLIAKHRHVHHLFSKQQRERSVKRTYEAFAEGIIADSSGCIEQPIGRKTDSIIEREVREDGQYALTYYEVKMLHRNFTLVELKLATGRTHQIRVHLAFIGHPLVGDDLYGGSLHLLGRQALHCRRLTFMHPFFKQTMDFEASLPDDMRKLLL